MNSRFFLLYFCAHVLSTIISMKVQKVFQNKYVLKGLEKISEHGTTFVALTSFAMSTTLRPLAISLTPDTEKRNKQYAVANSLSSGLIKLAMVEAVALPIEKAIKNIDKNPEKFLSKNTIKKLAGTKGLTGSGAYRFITLLMKLGAGLFMAIPKSLLTVAIIPVMLNPAKTTTENNKNISFTGTIQNKISNRLGKIINNEKVQNFAIKHQKNEKDTAKYISAATDTLLTATTAYGINKSKKLEQNRKKPLIYNNIISTAITIAGGFTLDGFIKSKSRNFIENFKKLHSSNPKLPKYIEGINILRPTLIFAGIYYGILPIFSTFISEKIDKHFSKKSVSNDYNQ